ncbi:MAG: hypothetical protein GF329_14275 [Candidatus Lokiarchaeota archaeon]|nr:hypothetical protein [Candidatus Lokiarchaeota archaeon]
MIRPNIDQKAKCFICGEESEDTISINPPENEKKYFCCVSHYYKWWFENSPMTKQVRNAKELEYKDFRIKLIEIKESLSKNIKKFELGEDKSILLNYIKQLDELLNNTPYSAYDILHVAIFLKDQEARGDLSPLILELKNDISIYGKVYRQTKNGDKITKISSKIVEDIEKIIK